MSTASALPDLIDALVTAATAALTDVRVSDGPGVTEDPGDYLLIGVNDPTAEGPDTAGDSTQRWAHANRTTRDEEGDLYCVASAWNGDSNQKAARDAAFAIAAGVAGILSADPTLGLSQLLWARYGGRSHVLRQGQDDNGAEALVTFTIHFRARL